MFTGWYKRWVHGHGFGVHSPFAYRLVTEVLYNGGAYGYYAYELISASRKAYPTLLSDRELYLVYRILVELRPATVGVCQSPSAPMLRHIVRLALPEAEIAENDAEMTICDRLSHVDRDNSHLKYAYFTNPAHPALAAIWEKATRGHLYRNPARALVVLSEKLPKQEFEVKF